MSAAIKYRNGQLINSIEFIKEVDPYIRPSGKKERCGMFVCPYCGEKFITHIQLIKNGKSKSCGCYALKIRTKHGLSGHSLYSVWENVIQRCLNPKDKHYEYYGGRDIKICDEWKSDFKTFYDWAMNNGYKKELTIDRIDTNGNYEPSNCRFVTRLKQSHNTRMSKANTSGYRGISFRKHRNNWEYEIKINGTRIREYGYETAKEAAIARNNTIKERNIELVQPCIINN